MKKAWAMFKALARQNQPSPIVPHTHTTAVTVNSHQPTITPQMSKQEQSLMCRLPSELLQSIFTQTLSPQFEGDLLLWMSTFQLPWEVSQVCRLWRNLAIFTPILWRRLPAIDMDQVESEQSSYLEFLEEMLKRSSGMPIHLHISARLPNRFPHPAMDILTQHSNRWQKLKVEATHDILPYLDSIKNQFSSLQALILFLCFDRPYSNPDLTFDIFNIAPKLDDVYLEGQTGSFVFPFNQLLRYSQRTVSRNQAFEVMRNSSSLRTLEPLGIPADTLLPDIILPNVTSLIVEFLPYTSNEWLFDRLTLPTVESLTITQSKGSRGDLIDSVRSMILRSRSPCVLKMLYIFIWGGSSGQLANLLKCTPFLECLGTTMPSPDDILALASNPDGPLLVPLLWNCTFKVEGWVTEETTAALNLLGTSRCEPDEVNHEVNGEILVSPIPATCERPFGKFILALDHYIAKGLQPELEGWVETDMSKKLKNGKELLQAALVEPFRKRVQMTRLSDSQKESLCSALNYIENLSVKNASDLSLSGAYDAVFGITFQNGDGMDAFCEIAQRILKKWNPVLEDSLKDVRWVVRGHTLLYLAKSHRTLMVSFIT
ncbi:hypothetical protein GALMADRAFT_160268 [Galerina marginata CBS 339.88]|uniref:Uncharacterized protein n=1 Tax=Galerina marginata (strain CBS 339.88) TaxID=685588 RepID=A0A067SSL7_GALM3|nr:hypothetical protein GALMADRAFT_160268 [Galerina marginata CBS 339.88]